MARGCPDKKAAIAELEVTMTYTLHNIAASYELLPIQKNDAILKNILYLGMRRKQDAVLNKYIEEEVHESL
ncbi:MAG: hypothetical protein IJF47_01330 [Candidatus Methanomethylophilaceae archaeon]|nr:hypothetical protein [Candidatus Methanomethylophilaceae archaeon]